MRIRLIVGWLVLFSLVAAIGFAQQPPSRTLSLAEALDIARRSSPEYMQVLNNRTPASRNLLSATTSLFTPSVTVGGSYGWTDAGRQYIQSISVGFDGPQSSQTGTSLGLNYSLSGATITRRGLANASLNATDQDIAGALTTLETSVRTQYLTLAQAQAEAAVSRRSLERAGEQLNLARARYAVGQGTLLDVRSAEVVRGTAEVTLLRADQNTENQALTLYQIMGVPAPTAAGITLTDSFPVVAPPWSVDTLLAFAHEQNPGLRSLRARESAAQWNTRAARSEYLPSLNVSAGTGHTTSHSGSFLQPDTAGNLITVPASTERSTNPWQVRVGLSLPIFDGFTRYTRTAEARAAQDDLNQQVRARELQVRTSVVSAFNSLQAAYRAIAIQESNKIAAAEALDLATQRYRVGSGSYLEQLDARLAADRADADYVSAVYGYHRAIATLENAVGRPLR